MNFDPDAYAAGDVQSFHQMYPVLAKLGQSSPGALADCESALEMARRFRREVIEPNALAIERKVARDPSYVAEDVVTAACRENWFTLMLPKIFGGQGVSFGALTVAFEEIAAGCLGLANLIGVHGLALSTLAATGDLPRMERIARRLVDSEKRLAPLLLSTAITEPGAGTDVEDIELLPDARLMCEAKPVRGGYRLNGRKVFISNGSIATTHVVIMPTDKKNPVATTFAFLVDAGTPGLSIGRIERKMGQKACPAAELVFEDCFIPEAARVSSAPLPGKSIDLVLGSTRGSVCAFGAGVARGAFERALTYAKTEKMGGRWLIDQQWVQFKLADMHRNVMQARAAYVESLISNELFGMASFASGGKAAELSRYIPRRVLDAPLVQRAVTSPRARENAQANIQRLPDWQVHTSSAFGAAAKVTGTDLGMQNCHLALDIFGADGLRHDRGIEKLFRDAKLLQIYEGTNQLNRLEVFKCAVMHGRGSIRSTPLSAPRAERRELGAAASSLKATERAES